MDETHVCVLDREGVVVRESKTTSTAEAIADELVKAPSCRRIVFETGRMAPILFHGLNQLGLPVVCVESRQAYQALKSLATHKTDRNDARGLAHLARTGFFKPVHVKSLPAHAIRSLISARKKLVWQRVTLEIRSEVWRSYSGSDCLARPPQPSSTRLSRQARGLLVFLPPCGV
jgi:transposase